MSQTIVNGISPWVIGQTHPTWRMPWTTNPGKGQQKVPVDLTGATVTLWIFKQSGIQAQGQGHCSVDGDPAGGVVLYAPAALDTTAGLINSTPGTYYVALKAIFSDGSVLWQFPAEKWLITKLP